eukprot:7723485-Alexandrium_andersonii.AAC.1
MRLTVDAENLSLIGGLPNASCGEPSDKGAEDENRLCGLCQGHFELGHLHPHSQQRWCEDCWRDFGPDGTCMVPRL